MPTLEITVKHPTANPELIKSRPRLVSHAIIRERQGKNGRKAVERLELPGLGSAGPLAFEAIRYAALAILRSTDEHGTPPPLVRTRR